jgi:superfamily II DNA or RNA helicase
MRCTFCIPAAFLAMQELQQQEQPYVNDSVRARRQRWRVRAIRSFESCQLITLRGTGTLNYDQEYRVVAPFERVERIQESQRVRRVRMRGYRRRCRALIAEARPAGALQTALHARIDLVPYQLEPALAIMRGEGSRVLIADEVGLGKTIQAGLIVAELKAFCAADRVLLLVPAGLREQWQSELGERFRIAAAIVDMAGARRRAAALPVDLNPWTTFPLAVTSIDYAKRPEVLPALLQCHWDVVVVDEAHGITPDSDRYRAVFALAARASHVVLLTATPHNGDRAAFDALCSLGQTSDGDPLLVFRRRRVDVAPGHARRVHRVDVRSSAAERRMYERLEQFSRALELERRADPAARLTLTMLHKRALSSAWSLETSVRRRLAVLDSSAANPFVQLALPLDDAGGELSPADEPPGWMWPSLENAERERRLLQSLADAAQQAALRETKIACLMRLLARLHARRESAIVFTEYRDTLAHVRRMLATPCALIHGGLSRDERRAALDDFRQRRCTVLLATDAAGEGLNLHHACRVVVNLELPWNPMRLEQRIGRVDRIGQTRRVHAFNLIASEVGEERLCERLAARIASARSAVGASNPLCEDSGDRIERLSTSEIVTADLPPAAVPLVRFDAEAESECQRLIEARRHCEDTRFSLAADVNRPWVARARKPITRARLGKHVLVILRQTCDDMAGHTVAARLVPLLIRRDWCAPRGTELDAEALLRRLEPELGRFQDDWLAQTAATIERFWQRRVARELSIALAADPRDTSESQPGLFDRRVERAQAARLDADRERQAIAERRLAVMARRSTVVLAGIRASLILVS